MKRTRKTSKTKKKAGGKKSAPYYFGRIKVVKLESLSEIPIFATGKL